MHTIFETSTRTFIGFVVLLILTRLLGKKQLSQITFFTYITGIALGNIAGDMVVHRDIKLIDGVTGLIVWSILTFIVELISLKSSKARIYLDGEPTIVIKKGIIMQKELAQQRLNMDDLTMLLRLNNVFSIQDVDYAILEPNGELSVLKKPLLESVIKKDMKIKPDNRMYLPTEIIVDGKLVEKNLKELNINDEWVFDQIKKSGINSVKDVFFAELQSDGTLYLSKKIS
ncbi:YetF domain-containing protein [Clostridium peptidivorans]|uniref:YetF domain-containing protein n=1 Tax=Clostridium peptidivorans TaxID=100174 RepID=UPI000BE2308B|nr:DUF421 domain-containing protein [Clostridium peptidivorans]